MGCSCTLVSQGNMGGLLKISKFGQKQNDFNSLLQIQKGKKLANSEATNDSGFSILSLETTHGLIKKNEVQMLLQINRRKVPILDEIGASNIISRRRRSNQTSEIA
jgi:hypothetical protein